MAKTTSKSRTGIVKHAVVKRKAMGASPFKGGTAGRRRHANDYISQKAERGAGLKFKLETFATVSKFTPGTRIKYGPNPKTQGSKSYARYASYMKAKTVGESLKLGAKSADLFWELERDQYKILGTSRTEAQEIAAIGRNAFEKAKRALHFNGPNGCAMKLDDPRAAEELRKEEAWRQRKLQLCKATAKELGLPVETTAQIEASTESADIRLQRRAADALAARTLKAGKKVTQDDVTAVLERWGFSENLNRLNVLPEGRKFIYSDTLGAIRRRTGEVGVTPPTTRYPNVPKLLFKWLKDNMPKLPCNFVCSAINVNGNYAGKRHRDQNNEGPSIIRAFGKFSGGKLRYWPKDVKVQGRPNVDSLKKQDSVSFDLAKTSVVFDGNHAHEVEPFKGERFSIVFFTAGHYGKLKTANKEFLKKKAGFPFPTPKELSVLKKATGTA
jgi:hypothetical protein